MNHKIVQRLEKMFYEAVIPDTEETTSAHDAVANAVKAWTDGKHDIKDSDLLYKLESVSAKQGFICGFQCAARMYEFLKEVSYD